MSTVLRVAFFPGELRLAVTQHNTLLDYALWRPAAPDGIGDVYQARISALMPAMGGAFVDLGKGESGFLPIQNGKDPVTEGQMLTVRVTRAAQGGKGLRVQAQEPPATPLPDKPSLLTRGPTPLERLADRWPQARITVDSSAAAALIPPTLRDRREQALSPFPEAIAHACDALAEASVSLPGGMTASITPTPALIAIDMDAPPTATGWTKQTAQFAANRDALPALFQQIRLRNLSGAILIDPAGLSTRKRQALLEPIKAMLQADPLRPRCLGITALGLVEIVRARIHPSLPELLSCPHGQALAALRIILANHPDATQIRGGLGIITALEKDPQALADCITQRGKALAVKLDPSLPDFFWTTDHD
ncbi:ribonuclease E/G [Acetobacter senegalensis]|uniref:ribonuclease E/G n=1 Tax=Acetobacter senegalensis TaxID=446692 RepID=UPI00264E8402|nr:ribonuclease E/G [Acetobacter senegalensis]MDN7355786.1 ribonuclease E/G [Acetobacter senegalensis]